jgi:exodeoxyribonuclease VII small subunit
MLQPTSESPVDAVTSDEAGAAIGGLKFEAALAELEQIVQSMEGGRLPLEESLAAYRRGSELLKHCQQQLGDAERQVQVLENGTLRDFEPEAGDAR